MSTETRTPLVVRIAPDRLTATIAVRSDATGGAIDAAAILTALEAAHIQLSDAVHQRVQEFLPILQDADRAPEQPLVIAEGRPVREGRDGEFTWDEAFTRRAADWAEDEAVDYYSVSSITTVEPGTPVGRIVPPVPGRDGLDVCGTPMRCRNRPQAVILNPGLELGDDGASVFAATAGRVLYQNNQLSISEVVSIAADVDFSTGNLNLCTDAMVRGAIRDRFEVETKKSLAVEGSIEAARIDAGEDVTVRGGILNRGRGHVYAGGEIVAKFCDEAQLRAEGDIRVVREIMNSRVDTEGTLLVVRGAIIGGQVFARRGVEAAILGSEGGAPTAITVGLRPEEIREIEQADQENEKRRASIEKVRQTVGPLMAQLKRLTGPQREKATELMYRADSIEAEIRTAEERRAELLAGMSGDDTPYVLVSSSIHPRVSVTVGDRVVVFREELRGPVKIERRKIKSHTVVAAVNQLTGSVRELPARRVELAAEQQTGEPGPTGR